MRTQISITLQTSSIDTSGNDRGCCRAPQKTGVLCLNYLQMRRSFFLKVFLATLLPCFLGIAIWILAEKIVSPEPPFVDKTSPHSLIEVKGLSDSRVIGNRLLTYLQADEFKVSPRKFFIFNVKPFNEATFSNVRFETHFYPDTPEVARGTSFILSEEETMPFKEDNNLIDFGLITRGVIKSLVWEIFNVDKLYLTVKAEKAHIDIKKNRTSLKNVTLEQMSPKRIIVSKTVIWNGKDDVFEIPGDYVALTPEGRVRGKGINLNLDFVANSFF